MKHPNLLRAVAITVTLTVAAAAQAANVGFTGNATYNTDIVRIDFSLTTSGAVQIWTDSWQSGLNYDPVVAVWSRAGSGYTLLGEVDDDDTIGPGQGAFDAGIGFASLGAGQYLLTIAASPNYARGSVLAAGFTYDGTTPIRIAEWNQPGYNLNTNDQKGTLWSVHLNGVTQAAVVPEPASGWLMALGLAGLAGVAGAGRRDSRRGFGPA